MLIKDICKIINGATPSTSCAEYWDGDIAWLTPKDLSGYAKRYISCGERSITQQGYNNCSTALVPKDTILLTSRAPIGYLAIAEKEVCTNQGFKSIICDKNKVIPLYLFYWLLTRVDYLKSISNGATFKELSKDTLENVQIELPNMSTQQHIVDTIGSVDDLIENIDQKLLKIKEYGGLLFVKNITNNFLPLLDIVNFEKGKEIGSLNYLDKQENGAVPYIRVGNLLNSEYDSYVINIDCPTCNVNDILIAFDGAPGRNNIGLYGCYSSGIQKVICDKKIKGHIYFYLNSDMCQNVIRTYSQGTTILHAGKAIKELMLPTLQDKKYLGILNYLYNEMISLIKKKHVLKNEKNLLLKKYFG